MPSVQIEDNHKVLLYMILILILYMIAIVQTLNCVLRRAITSVLTISPPSRILNNSGFRSLSIIRAGFPALAWLPGNGEGTQLEPTLTHIFTKGFQTWNRQ